MPNCAILSCFTNSNKSTKTKGGISYHRFPKDGNIKEKWINATGRPPGWFPTHSSSICSKHFVKTDIITTAHKTYLKPTAIPQLEIVCIQSLAKTDDIPSTSSKPQGTPPRNEIFISPSSSTASPRKRKLNEVIMNRESIIKRQRRQIKKLQAQCRRFKKKRNKMEDINELKDNYLRNEEVAILSNTNVQKKLEKMNTTVCLIPVKKEIVVNACCGCLSCDRQVQGTYILSWQVTALGEDSALFMHLLGRDSAIDPTNVTLCWECMAVLRKTRKFQQRIQFVQDAMQQGLCLQDLASLSTLTKYTLSPDTSEHIKAYSKAENGNQTSTWKTPGKVTADPDSLGKQESNIFGDKDVAVKFENEYDTLIELEDTNMEDLHQNLNEEQPGLQMKLKDVASESSLGKNLDEEDVDSLSAGGGHQFSVRGRIGYLQCKKIMATPEEYVQHCKDNHSGNPYDVEQQDKLCDICGKIYSKMSSHLKTHKQGQNREKCKFCEHKSSPTALVQHILASHTYKPYLCQKCPKRYEYKWECREHLLKVHAPVLPYRCEACSRFFAHLDYLNDHCVKVHGIDLKKTDRSVFLKYDFRDKIYVYPHMKIDGSLIPIELLSDTKVYMCDYMEENTEVIDLMDCFYFDSDLDPNVPTKQPKTKTKEHIERLNIKTKRNRLRKMVQTFEGDKNTKEKLDLNIPGEKVKTQNIENKMDETVMDDTEIAETELDVNASEMQMDETGTGETNMENVTGRLIVQGGEHFVLVDGVLHKLEYTEDGFVCQS